MLEVSRTSFVSVSATLVTAAIAATLILLPGATAARPAQADVHRIDLAGVPPSNPVLTVPTGALDDSPLPAPRIVSLPEPRLPLVGPAVPLGAPIKISAPLVSSGDVLSQDVSRNGARVVYLADQDVDSVQELYSVPSAGGAVTKLNPALVAGGDVLVFIISRDSAWVVYAADQDTDNLVEIYSVPIAGGTVTKLNGAVIPAGDITSLAISRDSAWVNYTADQDTDTVIELYSAPIAGGGATKISGPLVAGGAVTNFTPNQDSTRVIYRADQVTDEVFEVFSVPIAGGAVTKLNPTLVPGGDVGTPASIDGRTFYFADQEADEVLEYFSVPDAGGPVVKLNKPLIAGGDATNAYVFSTMAIYTADQDVNDVFEEYSVPVTGGSPVKLNPPLVLGGDIIAGTSNNPQIPDADTTAVYRADQDVDNVIELYSVPVAGGASTQLNGSLVAGGNVVGYGAVADGTLPPRVLYFADQDTDEVFEIYGVPLGGGAATKLNAPLVAGGDLVSVSFNGNGVLVYLADQDVDALIEVYGGTTAGVGPVTQLNTPLVAGGNVVSFLVTGSMPTRVVYRADQDVDEVFELYSTLLDGDADGDAVIDGQDCLTYESSVWSVPGEVTGLMLSHTGGAGGTTTLSWSTPASPGGTSPAYDTVRSAAASDFVTSATCVESNDGPNTTATDSVTPPSDAVAFFLVRAENICGIGTLGTSSAGALRAGRVCP